MERAEITRDVKEITVLPNSFYHSLLGEYFIGQTNMITFGGGYYSWATLANPEDSKVNLNVNIYTIANYGDISLTAEGWLSCELSGRTKLSQRVACSNQTMNPEPTPKVKIYNGNFVQRTPVGGSYVFVNRVRPKAMFMAPEVQGIFMIPPGGSFSLFFLSSGKEQVQLKVAFGWWEEKINSQ